MKDRLIADYARMNLMMSGADLEMRDACGVTFIQGALLDAISRGADQPHKAGHELGTKHSQSITGVLDRLEMLGYISRHHDVHGDRRGIRLALTAKSLELLPKIRTNLDRVAAEQYDAAGVPS